MTQVFFDDFLGTGLDPKVWQGGVPYGLLGHFPANSQVANSVLRLTWQLGQANPSDTSVCTIGQWATGLFEASIKWTPVVGAHPTFWGIPTNGTPYPTVELDIMEGLGQFTSQIYNTMHVWNKQTDLYNNDATNTTKLVNPDWSVFHKYGAQWDGKTVTWFFDGVQVNSWTPPAGSPAQPVHMIFSMHEAIQTSTGAWVGNDLTGVTATSMDMLIDWVRFSQ